MMWILIIASIVVFVQALIALINLLGWPALKTSNTTVDKKVSVLIPARNEEAKIHSVIQSVLEQRNVKLEIIVLNDESTDNTATILKTFEERIQIIDGKPLPEGWLGKNWACHQLAAAASGTYFCFADADVDFRHSSISSATMEMKKKSLHLLSLFPMQSMKSPGEWLAVPLMNFILLSLLPLKLVYLTKRSAFSAANGQFMMFEADSYLKFKWHEQVRAEAAEDIAISRLMKQHGLKIETLVSNQVQCRMYSSLAESVQGFSKNIWAMFFKREWMLPLIIFSHLVISVALFTSAHPVLFAAAGAIVMQRFCCSILSAQNPILNVLLHPFQILIMLLIAAKGLPVFKNKNLTWKERKIRS